MFESLKPTPQHVVPSSLHVFAYLIDSAGRKNQLPKNPGDHRSRAADGSILFWGVRETAQGMEGLRCFNLAIDHKKSGVQGGAGIQASVEFQAEAQGHYLFRCFRQGVLAKGDARIFAGDARLDRRHLF